MLRRYLSFGEDSGENMRLVQRMTNLLEKEGILENDSSEEESDEQPN